LGGWGIENWEAESWKAESLWGRRLESKSTIILMIMHAISGRKIRINHVTVQIINEDLAYIRRNQNNPYTVGTQQCIP
jgi:hypothetical protein